MILMKYFFSKYFFKQIFIVSIITGLLIFILFIFLNINTNHNNHILVPDLVGFQIEEFEEILNQRKLTYEIVDSTFYNPEFPKYSVLEQMPLANSKVKENRIIYLTINPNNYGNVVIPNVIQITKRSAISALLASGLEIGNVTFIDNIGKDMVIELSFQDEVVLPGLMIPKMSKIDLILGNGIKK